MNINISGIAKAISKVVAGDEGAQKFSKMLTGLVDDGINGISKKAAQVAGAESVTGLASEAMAQNADNATVIAKRIGMDVSSLGDDAVGAVSKEIVNLNKTNAGQQKLIRSFGGFGALGSDQPSAITADMFKNVSKETIEQFNNKMGHFKSAYLGGSDSDLAALLGREGKNSGGLKGLYKGVFQDPELGGIRKKAAVGAFGVGALGLRTLSGGDLTHNARGENDIAGIPFF